MASNSQISRVLGSVRILAVVGACGTLAGAVAMGVVPGASRFVAPVRNWLRPQTQQATPLMAAKVSLPAWRAFGQRSIAPRVVKAASATRIKMVQSSVVRQPAAKAGAQSTSAVGTRGLIGWWAAENSANDTLGINNGALPAAPNAPAFAVGKSGQGFVFDGVDDYVKLPDNLFPYPTSGTGNRPFSFELWFRTSGTGVILGQQTGPALGNFGGWVPALYVGNDGVLRSQLFYATNGSGNQILSSGAVNNNAFHHVALTYDGTLQKLYLDGAFVGQRVHTQQSYGSPYSYQLGIGYSSGWPQGNGAWFPFSGIIDEIALYNRALSFEEVRAIYDGSGSGRAVATVSNTADSGGGSLRAAITQANAQPGTIITFRIPSTDSGYDIATKTYTIRPQSALPALSGTHTLLSGTSQNGEAGDLVVLNGAQAGAAVNGLTLEGTNCMIEGLSIRAFGGHGIHVAASATGHTLSQNLLSDNGKLGINLAGGTEDANGVTANDGDDSDSGPNNLQNFPVVDGAFFAPNTSTLNGHLMSTPSTPFLIEIFCADAADASGYGEAPTYVGSLEVVTNASGRAQWTQSLGSTTFASKYFVMTATNLVTGDTSELSAARQMETVPTVTNTQDSGQGSLRAAMTFANAHRGTVIKFAIPTTDTGYATATKTFTITPQTPLPALAMGETFIDGSSQNVVSADRIVINGAQAGEGANGFTVQSASNTIHALEIRGFGGHGIDVIGNNSNNKLWQNLIHSNGKLGINLAGGSEDANGVTANDDRDLDNGANGLQNFPIIEKAFYNAGNKHTTISGRFNSSPSKNFRIEFFVSDAADASGYGEGAQYLSYDDVSTNESGNTTFTLSHNGDLRSKFVSVTAHRRDVGSASEFSAAQLVADWPNIVTNTGDSGPGSLRAAMEFANANPGTTISFDIPTTDNTYNSTSKIFTITPQSTLPVITAAGTRLDGASQNNASNDRVAIAGSQVGGTATGLTLQGMNGFVDDLDFHSWGGSGVAVSGATAVRNTLTRVTTHDNGKAGINLVGGSEDASGVTANDVDDSDNGPNSLQNFPIIESVFYNSTRTEIVVKGALQSTPSKTFTLQFFGSDAADASGYGEGARYLKEQSVTTDGTGRNNFEVVIDQPSDYALEGKFITATARRNDSPGTSEWSRPQEAVLASSVVTNT
ncbi:MAG: trimeric autotransporter adhesin, partial [Abditibacteriota bacterium]|nr:trimeric autotransporter adhesin [Abditibacteriota bacterium]